MSMPYATYSEFTAVYSYRGVSQAAINSYWLMHGSQRVNQALGNLYTTPFSSNNWTAKDLTIQYAALGILVRTQKIDDSEELLEQIKSQITDITSGNQYMMDTSGSALLPDRVPTKNEIWSTTQGYKPTFDMRDAEHQRIDPDWLDDNFADDL